MWNSVVDLFFFSYLDFGKKVVLCVMNNNIHVHICPMIIQNVLQSSKTELSYHRHHTGLTGHAEEALALESW